MSKQTGGEEKLEPIVFFLYTETVEVQTNQIP